MIRSEAARVLLRMGNGYLMQAINQLRPEIALSHGLDQAVMLAVLDFDFLLSKQVRSLVEIEGVEYSTNTIEHIIEVTGIWDFEQALNIVSCLESSELISVISDFRKGKMIYRIN